MRYQLKSGKSVLYFAAFCFIVSLLCGYSYGETLSAKVAGDKLVVNIDGKVFTSYKFSHDLKRPYFWPVIGPVSGKTVTVESTEPYPHHNSIFFGCDRVNGGNYWQEGNERGQILSQGPKIIKSGGDKVVFTDTCLWKMPGKEAIIRDERVVTITAPSSKIRFIDFEVTMIPLTEIVIQKTNHSLFSARVRPELGVKEGGTLINMEGEETEKGTFGKPSAWCDYYGTRDGVTEGVAILQNPTNRWYPSKWFTRDYGFMSPTPMYWPENGSTTKFAKGEEFTLQYRVVVHAGDVKQAGIAQIFNAYANEASMAKLNDLLAQLAAYEQDKSRIPLIALENMVINSYGSAGQRKAIAGGLVKTLGGNLSHEAKAFICEQLSIIGTSEHVGAIAKLLNDDKSVDIACFALQRIPGNASSKALLSKLGKLEGRAKIAVINTLANKDEAKAIDGFVKLAKDRNKEVASAAIYAIAAIDSGKTVGALEAVMGSTRGKMRLIAGDACITYADKVLAKGKLDEAGGLYRLVYDGKLSDPMTAAAFGGLIESGYKGVEVVARSVLKGEDDKLLAVLMRGIRGGDKELANTVATHFGELSAGNKVVYLSALSGENKPLVLTTVLEATENKDAVVRIAAIESLGRIGNGGILPVLIEKAAKGEKAESATAAASMMKLSGAGVDEAIAGLIKGADAKTKCLLIEVAVGRDMGSADGEILKCVTDADATVRLEAIKALRSIGGSAVMARLADQVTEAKSSREQKEIGRTLISIAKKTKADDSLAVILSAKYTTANDTAAKVAILDVLSNLDGGAAGKALKKGLGDSDANVRKSAIRGLSGSTRAANADTLLGAAKNDSDQTNRILAIRGYIKLVTLDTTASSSETVGKLGAAMRVCERADEKKMILATLPGYNCPAAVAMVKEAMKDNALKAEAKQAFEKMNALKFDMQPEDGKVMDGFVGVSPSTAYNDGRGYGWVSVPGASRDRAKGNDLQRDFVFDSKPKVFRFKTGNGSYRVTVYLGDMTGGHDKMMVSANGDVKVDGVTNRTGEIKEVSFDAKVTKGLLDLEFSDGGGSNGDWCLVGIAISSL